ncbi:MAG: N-acetylmuramoyl-L-alanine amidase [Ruminococcaceae bacterium]|nr:N-acetylmuramoyl-L-alanine amidase [Oscillospiraceae bacterium]
MKRIGILLMALIMILCACDHAPAPTEPIPTRPTQPAPTETVPAPTAAPTDPTTPTEPQPTEPVVMHAHAVEDHLLPLEEYSDPRTEAPEFVVIHFISAVVNHRADPYNIDLIRDIFIDYNLSIHYVIQRDGTVHCYIPEDRVAWHAGKGEWNGDPKYTNTMNRYSIGIELIAMGSESDMSIYMSSKEYRALDSALMGYTDAQYASLKCLVTDICRRNGIPMDRRHVIGHEEYSAHKTDPGELFDWSRLIP